MTNYQLKTSVRCLYFIYWIDSNSLLSQPYCLTVFAKPDVSENLTLIGRGNLTLMPWVSPKLSLYPVISVTKELRLSKCMINCSSFLRQEYIYMTSGHLHGMGWVSVIISISSTYNIDATFSIPVICIHALSLERMLMYFLCFEGCE